MTALVRSELLKLRTTRTALGIGIGMLALVLLITLATGLASDTEFLSERQNQFQLLASGSIAAAFAAILGIMAMTTEFRHGTIRPTLLATPNRTNVLLAKVAASALTGVALGAIGVGVSFVLGKILLSTRDVPSALSGSDVALVLLGTLASAALWGAFGAGLGAILRSQVGAIVGLLIWVLFLEHILFALFPDEGKYLPGQASNALTQIEASNQLSVAAGTLVFVAYVAAAAVAGAYLTERRDVS
jgi:ABC-2 type transport system permease protein